MRWKLNSCRKQRENASLLASGLLPEADAASLREHLTSCAGCCGYYDEIVLLSGEFRKWSATQAPVEVPPSLHARWLRSIDSAGVAPKSSWVELLKSLWPSPAAWGALGAVWIGLIVLQSTTPDSALTQANTASKSKPFTLAQRQRELSSLLESMSQPVSSTITPALPGPRSDWRDRPVAI
jgi:anti-sigma factor RsiW